jgi:hypothetical protein
MYLNKNTKDFLLYTLREETSMGGGVGMTPGYGSSIAPYDPSETEIDPVTGKTKKKKKESESLYYKNALQTALGSDIDLSKETSGKPSLAFLGALGTAKRRLGYKLDPNAETGMRGGESLVKDAVAGVAGAGLAGAALSFMGPLGQSIAGKLPYLTAMGVDPLDYATKVMGVDYVSKELGSLAKRQTKQITSGAGNIKL